MNFVAVVVLCYIAAASAETREKRQAFSDCSTKPGAVCDYNCKTGYFEEPNLRCGILSGKRCCVPPVKLPSSLTTIVPPLNICGVSKYGTEAGKVNNNNRIVGGVDAYPNEFPWIVSLQLDSEHFCGGSIINNQWILTAAHCFQDINILSTISLSKLRVVAGEHRILNSDTTEVYSKVSKVIPARWNQQTMANDIALVKLATPLKFNQNIREVCLADENIGNLDRNITYVAGWGTARSGAFFSPNTLQKAQIASISNIECNNKLGIEGASVDSTMICASGNGKDTCQGDSGGPMIMRKSQNSQQFIQIGVVSWGIECAKGYPGVYTRVSYYRNWIDRTIAQN